MTAASRAGRNTATTPVPAITASIALTSIAETNAKSAELPITVPCAAQVAADCASATESGIAALAVSDTPPTDRS